MLGGFLVRNSSKVLSILKYSAFLIPLRKSSFGEKFASSRECQEWFAFTFFLPGHRSIGHVFFKGRFGRGLYGRNEILAVRIAPSQDILLELKQSSIPFFECINNRVNIPEGKPESGDRDLPPPSPRQDAARALPPLRGA